MTLLLNSFGACQYFLHLIMLIIGRQHPHCFPWSLLIHPPWSTLFYYCYSLLYYLCFLSISLHNYFLVTSPLDIIIPIFYALLFTFPLYMFSCSVSSLLASFSYSFSLSSSLSLYLYSSSMSCSFSVSLKYWSALSSMSSLPFTSPFSVSSAS